MPMTWLTLLAACTMAALHLFAGKLSILDKTPRSRWLSFAGGMSVAYVFLHLLPELAQGQQAIKEVTEDSFGFLKHHAYLVAFAGLVIFYGLEHAAKTSRRAQRASGEEDAPARRVFWLHMASFVVYNVLIGYLLIDSTASPRNLLFFFAAMALHFLVTDYGMREHYKDSYARGRWLLALAVLGGWLLGLTTDLEEVVVSLLIAFLAGGVILNVLKEELPDERQSRFSTFLIGGVSYAALLLAL